MHPSKAGALWLGSHYYVLLFLLQWACTCTYVQVWCSQNGGSNSSRLLEWWKDPKEQQYQEWKMMKGYSLVKWRARKKKMAVVLWKKWQKQLLALCEEKDALSPAVTICTTMPPCFCQADCHGHCCNWMDSCFAICDEWITEYEEIWSQMCCY